MEKKKLSLALCSLLGGLLSFSTLAADVTLKLGHPVNEDHSWHKASLKFAELVKQKTNNAVEVKIYPNESLGKEMDIINAIQLGSVDMTITGESLQNWAPSAALLAVPYMITSSEQMAKIVDGEVGAQISKDIEERVKLKTIAWFERGPRNLTSNRPITNPEELKGLTLRLPNVPMFINVWKDLGAQPTPMAFSEVFTGLQQGVIEGQENPLSMIMSGSFFEVQKYLNRTEHVRSWIYLVMGSKKFNKLKPEFQQAILDAGKEAQAYEHELYLQDEDKLIEALQAKGMTLVDVHQNEFARIANKSVENSINPQIKPLYEKALATK